MKPLSRKLLDDDGSGATQSASFTFSPHPRFQPIDGSSTVRKHLKPHAPFDSSMALTVLVLVTALFFMGFFSVYIRRFAEENSVNISRRRRYHPDSVASSSASTSSNGLDLSIVTSLPLFSYRGDAKEPIECPICLSEFEDGETMKVIPYCCHVFHPQCIDTWFRTHVTCPLCRSTKLLAAKNEVCLNAAEDGRVDRGATESTVDRGDAWVEVGRVVVALGVRRSSSGSSLGERGSLQRTMSF